MKNGWALLVTLTLLVCGILSVSSRYQEDAVPVALQNPSPVPPAAKRETASTKAALAMIGMPGVNLPEPQAPSLKVLLTAEEKRARSEKLADKRTIEAAAIVLKNPEKDFDRRDEKRRMNAVSYLALAAHWSENPERDAIFNSIDESIAQENLTAANVRQKKSIAGDKIELFEILLREAPERAAQIEERARGTWLSPILHYARGRFDFFSKR